MFSIRRQLILLSVSCLFLFYLIPEGKAIPLNSILLKQKTFSRLQIKKILLLKRKYLARRRKKIRLRRTSRLCPWKKYRGRRSRLCLFFARKKRPKERFIVVIGRRKRLYLCRGSRLLKSFPIGHGRRGFGKRREGDKKTPLGSYKILWMAARHEPYRSARRERALRRYQIRNHRAYCKPNPRTGISEFRRDHGPRGERLWRPAYGGRYATVMAINYPNQYDRKAHRTGSCIEIHASFHLKGSAGCITLWPRHARQLYNCSFPNMRVEIRYSFK